MSCQSAGQVSPTTNVKSETPRPADGELASSATPPSSSEKPAPSETPRPGKETASAEVKVVDSTAPAKTEQTAAAEVIDSTAPAKTEQTAAAGKPSAWSKNLPYRAAGAHILISYADAPSPFKNTNPTRSKEEASKLALEVLSQAAAPGADWTALLHKYSDDPRTSKRSGELPIFVRGQFRSTLKTIETALMQLNVGEFTDVLETDHGFHVVKRIPLVELSAEHLVIKFKGCQGAQKTTSRSKKEALQFATQLAKEAQTTALEFSAVVERLSDDKSPYKQPIGTSASWDLDPALAKEVISTKVGHVGGPVETAYGFVVFKRHQLVRRGALQLLVSYEGADASKEDYTRTKEEAKKHAEEIFAYAEENNDDFFAIMKKFTDRKNGVTPRDLGLFNKEFADHAPPYWESVSGAKVGELFQVETRYGFHVGLRRE